MRRDSRGPTSSYDTNLGWAVFAGLSNRLDVVAIRVVVVTGRVIVGHDVDFVLFAGRQIYDLKVSSMACLDYLLSA